MRGDDGRELYCWGDNSYGELGIGDDVHHTEPHTDEGVRAVQLTAVARCGAQPRSTRAPSASRNSPPRAVVTVEAIPDLRRASS